MNLESDELVRIHPCRFSALMSLANFRLTSWMAIAHCLSPSILSKTERLHLLRILRLSCEMKQPRTLAVLQKSLAFEFSCVPRDA